MRSGQSWRQPCNDSQKERLTIQTRFIARAAWGAMAAAAMLAAGSAQAALQDFDLNDDTVADAFYDTDLNITWLRDANLNGSMNWATAVSWADNLSFGGYTDWRLPNTTGSCTGYDCTCSEAGHLGYVELGNSAGAMTNTGAFQNLLPANYWAAEYAAVSAFTFGTSDGLPGVSNKGNTFLAMAVRPGDIAAAIPEPETYSLMWPAWPQ